MLKIMYMHYFDDNSILCDSYEGIICSAIDYTILDWTLTTIADRRYYM